MKSSWEREQLGRVCDILDSQRRPITKRDRTNGGYPYYGSTGIVDYVGDFIFDEPLVLVGEDGAKWGPGENSAFRVEGKCWVNNHAHVLRPHRSVVLDGWLIHYLNHADLSEHVSGLTVPKLTQGSLREIPIPVPPVAEQRRIVAVLDEAFAGLAVAKANAEKNLQNARALFEGHLESVFAEDWRSHQLVKLADLATDITDGDHVPPPKSAAGVPFITIRNVNKGSGWIDFGDTFMVPRPYYDGLSPAKKPRQGDVLYTVTGSFGIPVRVPEGVDFCFQRHIGLIRPNALTNSSWLYYLLLSPQVFTQAQTRATGAAQRTVALRLLRSFEVPRVPLVRQIEIAARLDLLFAATQQLAASYRQRLLSLESLSKSLLHQAFTGNLT